MTTKIEHEHKVLSAENIELKKQLELIKKDMEFAQLLLKRYETDYEKLKADYDAFKRTIQLLLGEDT